MLDSRERKRQKDGAKSVKVELSHLTQPRGGHILHEKEYNTGHGVQAIPNEICGKIRRQPSQPEVQQEPVLYLFLAGSLGRECGVSGLSVQASSQSSKSANPPFCLTSLATLRVPYHIQIMSCNISFFLKIKKERPKLSLFFFPIIKIFVQRL